MEKQYIVFNLKDEKYIISIDRIYEIIRLKEIKISKIPKVPNYIEGIINLRGDVVPIINLRKKIGIEDKSIDKKSRIIILNTDEKIIGILVDSVLNVVVIDDNNIFNTPEEIKEKYEYIDKIGKNNNDILFMFNTYKMTELYKVNKSIDEEINYEKLRDR